MLPVSGVSKPAMMRSNVVLPHPEGPNNAKMCIRDRSRGNCVYYSIADPSVYEICELVCGQISNRLILEADIKKLFSSAQQSST